MAQIVNDLGQRIGKALPNWKPPPHPPPEPMEGRFCRLEALVPKRHAKRLGLSYEGIFRQATVYKGRSRDTAWYAAIDAEWPALHRAFSQWLDPGNFDEHGRRRARLSDLTRSSLKAQG